MLHQGDLFPVMCCDAMVLCNSVLLDRIGTATSKMRFECLRICTKQAVFSGTRTFRCLEALWVRASPFQHGFLLELRACWNWGFQVTFSLLLLTLCYASLQLLRYFKSFSVKRGGKRKRWEKLGLVEKRRDELSRGEKSWKKWQEVRRAETSWEELRRWAEVRVVEKSWEELRRGGKRRGELRRGETSLAEVGRDETACEQLPRVVRRI
jgi:hypothetical protein